MDNKRKGCFGFFVIAIGFVVISAKVACDSSNESTTTKEDKQSLYSNTPLSKADLANIRSKLIDIGRKIQASVVSPDKATIQLERVLKMYVSGNASEYDVYRAANIAKDRMEDAYWRVNKIEIPNHLPKNSYDDLNIVLSRIKSSFVTKQSAFDLIIEIIDSDNPKVKMVDDYHFKMGLAAEEWSEAGRKLLILLNKFPAKPNS